MDGLNGFENDLELSKMLISFCLSFYVVITARIFSVVPITETKNISHF